MLKKFVADVQTYFRARDAENALVELSDAALDDIGLTRADLTILSARPEPIRTTSAYARDLLVLSLPFQPIAQAA